MIPRLLKSRRSARPRGATVCCGSRGGSCISWRTGGERLRWVGGTAMDVVFKTTLVLRATHCGGMWCVADGRTDCTASSSLHLVVHSPSQIGSVYARWYSISSRTSSRVKHQGCDTDTCCCCYCCRCLTTGLWQLLSCWRLTGELISSAAAECACMHLRGACVAITDQMHS